MVLLALREVYPVMTSVVKHCALALHHVQGGHKGAPHVLHLMAAGPVRLGEKAGAQAVAPSIIAHARGHN